MKLRSRPRPVVLCILDGWGERAESDHNAIRLAGTPNFDRFLATCPHATLDASAEAVGLPSGQMGNSEVGHTNIGAGRAVLQDLPRIDKAIADGSLAQNPALTHFTTTLRTSGGACHLVGLLSPGGVHSHQDHVAALARYVAAAGVPVRLHALLDGRDTPPRSARAHLARFRAQAAQAQGLAPATVMGRYYAMDRDRRWERVKRAYDAMVDAKGAPAPSLDDAIAAAYQAGEGDEFVTPRIIAGYGGMADGDGLLMANFRADRARQILGALLDPAFSGFGRHRVVSFAATCGMTSYSSDLDRLIPCLFPPERLTRTLGEIISEAGLTQLRIAETEKYAHVTFFFNGGEETIFPGESRILVPSPRVASYDLKPEMSAREVTDRLVEAVASGRFDFVLVNYANSDMVGHTGDLGAAIKAVETVDACLGRLARALREAGGALLITADHGNVEQMREEGGEGSHTAHTTNLVPVILVNDPRPERFLRDGRLADVAPTILELMGLSRPEVMTGHSLLAEAANAGASGAERRVRA